MRKVVLAVRDSDDSEVVLSLFRALRLADAAPTVVHIIEPAHPAALSLSPEAAFGLAEELDEILEAVEAHGKAVLESAKSRLASEGIEASTALLHGHPVEELVRYCTEEDVDLILMGSEKKGPVAAALFGSMSRAMAQHARRSLAIAKQPIKEGNAIHAVLATDHSEYMERCVEELIRLAPHGINRLDLVTAFTAESYLQEHALGRMPVMSDDVLDRIVADLENKNDALKSRLHSIAPVIHSHVVRDHAIPAIKKVMQETEADLLILGAHGHSAIERLLMGSVSHHMVAVEPFSVWILRPKSQA
ncbi:MAG: hypothetical protein KatS3mg015_1568 [Fimbriimonadales bacterium]|nr:MAG: hypothetical protein KatS3mg015_1568 [Fimbriimonadales bacterium]